MFDAGDLVSRYTRVEALKDSLLFDVSPEAREAGFSIPVAVTARVWSTCVAWPETETAIQDERGRTWDLVFMAAVAARTAARRQTDRVTFELRVVPRGERVPRLTSLVLHIGPGDQGEPVITIMAPGED